MNLQPTNPRGLATVGTAGGGSTAILLHWGLQAAGLEVPAEAAIAGATVLTGFATWLSRFFI